MAFLFELLPLLAFVVAYRVWDIYVATGVITAAVLLQLAYRKLRGQPITTVQKVFAALLLVMGGLTLALHDDRFILWKPTIFYWVSALGLGIGQAVMSKPVLETFIGEQFKLSPQRWAKLTWVWIGMMTFLGALNLYIAFNFPRNIWVNSKLGLYGLFVVFVLAQTWWIIVRWEGIDPALLEDGDKADAAKKDAA